MMRLAFLLFCWCLPFSVGAKSPNVLFIAVDDWNDWVGAMGSNQAITPNLDRLAARGVVFTNAHTNAVYCAPSRTSLMTGYHPHTLGAYHDQPHFAEANHPGIKDLPRWFRDHGYYTVGGGKLYHHMPGFIDQRSWDHYFIWNADLKKKGWGLDSWGSGSPLPRLLPSSPMARYLYELEKKRHPHKSPKKLNSHMEWAILPNAAEKQMADTQCAQWASDFFSSYSKPKPFFLGFGLYAPHKPNFIPQKYYDLYPPEKISLPVMPPDELGDLPPKLKVKTLRRKQRINDPLRKLNGARDSIRGYLAAISYADAMVGRVLDALEKSPHAENTIIVLWSDNGYHLGEKGCWAKHTLWERTSNVPLIFAGPGIASGQKVDTTVSLLDVYPTLVGLCGIPHNSKNEGHSLAGILKNPGEAKDRTVLQCLDANQYALINQNWRYVQTAGGEEQLYDLRKDPAEHHNLASRPSHQKRLQMFAKQLPSKPAHPGKRPQDKDFILKINGEGYQWVLRKKSP